MKSTTYLLTIAVFGAATAGVADGRVENQNVPAAVKQAVRQENNEATLQQITRQVENDRTVYEVRWSQPDGGEATVVTFAEDGTVIRRRTDGSAPAGVAADDKLGTRRESDGDRAGRTTRSGGPGEAGTAVTTERYPTAATVPGAAGPGAWATGTAIFERYSIRTVNDESAVRPEDLPADVRRGIEREAPGREIADIDRETWKGRTIYEVEFADSGVNPQLHFAEDGTLIQQAASVIDATRNFFAGTQITDTPAAVQETIRREAADGRVTDIDIERRTGRTVYEVEIENAQDRFEIHIAENGDVLPVDRKVAE